MNNNSDLTKYIEPKFPVKCEEKIKRSVFIANVGICHNEDEANIFLKKTISEYRDATHNCRAYILGISGTNESQEYFSDDGEPSGTAGRPILLEIKKSGFSNTMVIVTRYFGGVKLGTRGLIDAYSGTAAKALKMLEPELKIITKTFRISFDYSHLGLLNHTLENYNSEITDRIFNENVILNFKVPLNFCESISSELNELQSRGIIKNIEYISE